LFFSATSKSVHVVHSVKRGAPAELEHAEGRHIVSEDEVEQEEFPISRAAASTSTAQGSSRVVKTKPKHGTCTSNRAYAFDSALEMQKEEHELQMKYLQTKIKFEEEEHKKRMEVLELQHSFLTKLNSRENKGRPTKRRTGASDTDDDYPLYPVYTQL
jgi:hypothetical protein